MSVWLAVSGALLTPAAALARVAAYRSLRDTAPTAPTNMELLDLAAVHHRTAWWALLLAVVGVVAALVGVLLLIGPGEVLADPRLLGWMAVGVLLLGYLGWLAMQAFLPTGGPHELIVADAVPTQRRITNLVDGAQRYPYPVIRWTGMLTVTAWAGVHLWIVVRLRRHGR
ncbi:hypothetical protein [Micromonospora sp. LOL_023]|uniref:hypothetical protein n=1 Tax=Micromonospora sp. LOL_023 TaxID=3345418 RepID=UPI003A84EDE9